MNVRPHCLKHLSTRGIKTGSVLQNMQARRSGEAEQGNHLGTPLVIPSAAQQVWAVLYCPGMFPGLPPTRCCAARRREQGLSWQLLSYHRLCQQPPGSWHGPLGLVIEILICKEGYKRAVEINKINEVRQIGPESV